MSATHTPIPRHPAWAERLAQNAVYTDGYVRLTDLPEREFERLAPHCQGVVAIGARLCVPLSEFSRLITLLL